MNRSRMAATAGAVLLALAAAFAAGAPANAVGGGDVSCGGTQVTTYDPGLVLTERPTRVHLVRRASPSATPR